MKPSIHQQRIYDFIENETGSAVIQACAGSGKTTTIINALNLIPANKRILMLAFNKTIADELKARVPQHVTVKTFNGLGHSMLWKRVGSLQIESRKMRDIVKGIMSPFDYLECGNGVVELVNFARRCGLRPNTVIGREILPDETESWNYLIEHFSIQIERDYRQLAIDTARLAIAETVHLFAADKIVDFDDQIYIPVIKGASMCDKYDFVFVDEAQDASATRIKLVEMSLAENGRMIAVGDRFQSIYGFTGADSKAMQIFEEKFNAVVLPLSISYRCAKSIVKEAQDFMPEIEPAENAVDGCVLSLDEWNYKNFNKGDLIICRKSAPLVSQAWELTKKGVGCRILGRDISSGLVGLIQKLKPKGLMGKHGLEEKLTEWLAFETKRLIDEDKPDELDLACDKVKCIQSILSQTTVSTVPDLIRSIEAMFSDDENGKNIITLCTVHKSKGLEADTVFILNRDEMPSKAAKLPWQIEQENNLIYVAITRAKSNLFYISTNG